MLLLFFVERDVVLRFVVEGGVRDEFVGEWRLVWLEMGRVNKSLGWGGEMVSSGREKVRDSVRATARMVVSFMLMLMFFGDVCKFEYWVGWSSSIESE